MKKAQIKIHNINAGILIEENQEHYIFQYHPEFNGPPISQTLPVRVDAYEFKSFPPFFDGLLPEGIQLEGLIKKYKIDKNDYFQQLLATGHDFVGAVTVEKITSSNE